MRFSFPAPNSRSRPWLALLLATLIAAMGVAVFPASAQADTGDELSWSVSPGGDTARSNFSYELDPGAQQDDSFVVTNLGAQEITLAVYAADGTTSSTGALDLLPAADPSTTVGAWVTVDQPTITLAPGAQADVDFTLKVPADVEPGDYVGGLVSSYVDTASGGTVHVDRRLATRMNIRISGEGRLSLTTSELSSNTETAWNPFAPVQTTASFTLSNTGTVRARGSYTVTVAGPFGWGNRSTTRAANELIPHGSTVLDNTISGFWPLGWSTTTVTFTPEGIDSVPGETSTLQISHANVPWGQLILLVILIGAAVFIGLRRGRTSREPSA